MTSPAVFNLTPQETLAFTTQFKSLLAPGKNGLTGMEARGFFMQSKIPPNELGQIWGLVDLEHNGVLNFGQFCAAMKLIRLKVQNKATNGAQGSQIPTSLPPPLLNFIRSNPNMGANSSSFPAQNRTEISRIQTGLPTTASSASNASLNMSGISMPRQGGISPMPMRNLRCFAGRRAP